MHFFQSFVTFVRYSQRKIPLDGNVVVLLYCGGQIITKILLEQLHAKSPVGRRPRQCRNDKILDVTEITRHICFQVSRLQNGMEVNIHVFSISILLC
jgi:hypothetical protein